MLFDNLSVEELNKQINELQQKRKDLLKNEDEKKIEEIKNLEWTKKCEAKLVIENLVAAGLPKYKLIFYFDFGFVDSKFITLMGNSQLYEYNIMLRTKDYWHNNCQIISTNSPTLLIEFLNKAKFINIEYNKDDLEILKTLEKLYG